MDQSRQPVLVTTEYHGVFFGYLVENDAPQRIVLADARNCVYWPVSIKGFLGLAASGPNFECRIGPKASNLTLYKITSFAEVSLEAVQRWEEAPWR